ncbi:MAG: DUF3106 domain-containing protein [Rhodoferax sp.]|jgi:hypothetical protein|nr:DUF3106 domain-containing protein [Rhodoferax sp.]
MSVRAVVDQQNLMSLTNAVLSCVRDCIVVVFAAIALSLLGQGSASAVIQIETRAKPPVSHASAPKTVVLPIVSGPTWQELTPVQKVALKPLATQWNTLDDARKRKWTAIAANYLTLPPEGQAKLHSRMTEWVSLSQQQRAQARLNFAESKQLTPTQKAATWEAYQALSPEERQKLALSAPPKPTGAAPAAKPVPPQKLTAVPVTRKSPPPKLPASAAVPAGPPAKTLTPPPPALEPASAPIH